MPWKQPRRKSTLSLVEAHTNATRVGWQLWEIDLRFPLGYLQGESALWSGEICGAFPLVVSRVEGSTSATLKYASIALSNDSNSTTARPAVQGAGFRIQGSGFRVQDSGFRVQGSGFRVQDECRVQGSGFRVQGSGFRVQGLGVRVKVEG